MSAAANAAASTVNTGLATVCRVLAGVIFTGAAAGVVGFTPIHVYRDEVEFAAMEPQVLVPTKHRCNDRLEDLLEVREVAENTAAGGRGNGPLLADTITAL